MELPARLCKVASGPVTIASVCMVGCKVNGGQALIGTDALRMFAVTPYRNDT